MFHLRLRCLPAMFSRSTLPCLFSVILQLRCLAHVYRIQPVIIREACIISNFIPVVISNFIPVVISNFIPVVISNFIPVVISNFIPVVISNFIPVVISNFIPVGSVHRQLLWMSLHLIRRSACNCGLIVVVLWASDD